DKTDLHNGSVLPVNCPITTVGRHRPVHLGGLIEACPTLQRCDPLQFWPEVIDPRARCQPIATETRSANRTEGKQSPCPPSLHTSTHMSSALTPTLQHTPLR